MGDEEKKDPPPPSLSKPTPPPPSLSKPEPAPSMPPASGISGPPVIQAAVKVDASGGADDELLHESEAPLNSRLLGGLIDGLVATGLAFVTALIMPEVLDRLAMVVWIAYMMTRDSLPFLKGQSIGKTAMKLKVVKNDGSDLVGDWATAIIRNILFVIPFFGPLVEAIILISRDGKPEKGLRLGDDFSKTKVVVWRPEEAAGGEGG